LVASYVGRLAIIGLVFQHPFRFGDIVPASGTSGGATTIPSIDPTTQIDPSVDYSRSKPEPPRHQLSEVLLDGFVGELLVGVVHMPPAVTAGAIVPVMDSAGWGDITTEDVLVDPVWEEGKPIVLEVRPDLIYQG
jgi:hypothetical protein